MSLVVSDPRFGVVDFTVADMDRGGISLDMRFESHGWGVVVRALPARGGGYGSWIITHSHFPFFVLIIIFLQP